MHVLIFLPCKPFLFKLKVSLPTLIKPSQSLPATSHWPILQLPQPLSDFLLDLYSLITTTPQTMRNLIFEDPEVGAPDYAPSNLRYAWESIRAPVIIPLLKLAVILCSAMSIMLFVERVVMATVILIVKVLGKKKYRKYNLDAMKQKLQRNKRYPKVLIQIPMYNEKEVPLPFN